MQYLSVIIITQVISCAPGDTFGWDASNVKFSDTSTVEQSLEMMCPSGSMITSVKATYSDQYSDRAFTVKCYGMNAGFSISPADYYLSSSKQVYHNPNTMHGRTPFGLQAPYHRMMSPVKGDSPWTRQCEDGYVLTGVISQYISRAHAREWDFRCSRIIPNVYSVSLAIGKFNDYYEPIDMTVSSPSSVIGFKTERQHSSTTTDRKWSLLSSVLCKVGPAIDPTLAPATPSPISTVFHTNVPMSQSPTTDIPVTESTAIPSPVQIATVIPITELPTSMLPKTYVPFQPSLVTLREGQSRSSNIDGNPLYLYDKTIGWIDDSVSHYDRVPEYMKGASLWLLSKQILPNELITITCNGHGDTSSVCDIFIMLLVDNKNNLDSLLSNNWIVTDCAPIAVDQLGIPNQMIVLRKAISFLSVEEVYMPKVKTPFTGIAVHVFSKNCKAASEVSCETGADYCRWSSRLCHFGDSCGGSIYSNTPPPTKSPTTGISFSGNVNPTTSSSSSTTSILFPILISTVGLCGVVVCIYLLLKDISKQTASEHSKVLASGAAV